ncbi:MAG TPA: response regulator [Blastocatellia bacterium]|jgi:CheY-like chemotaxis protein
MAAEPPLVLLVEDHEDTRKMLELLFDEWGYRATLVSTATEGLRCMLEQHFDVVVLDNWLPDLDGVELCRQIREFNRQTPIIFYSAAAMGSEDREALASGANAFIYKGSGLASLREALAVELGKVNDKPRKAL